MPIFSVSNTPREEYDFRQFLDPEINSTRFYMLVLYALARANGSRKIVELGTYRGQTTCVLAAAAKANDGHVWTVDNGREGVSESYVEQRLQDLGLRQYVDLVRADSALALPTFLPDFVFVDADHSYEGVTRDFDSWAWRLAYGGFMCLHDSQEAEGVHRFIMERFPDPEWEGVHSPGDCGLFIARKIA